jgi:hypothetical protein
MVIRLLDQEASSDVTRALFEAESWQAACDRLL